MQREERDMARLWDMLDSARAAVGFVQGKQFRDFMDDRMLRNAVERCLEVVGEAARCVTPKTREANPEIPWAAIIGLRNVITHEYGDIRHDRLWSICVTRLPTLIRQLEGMGADNPPPQDGD